MPELRRAFRVVSYDRRGHSRSTTPGAHGTMADHAKDLETIVTLVARGPAHIVATSAGAVVALRFAAARPELVRSLHLHDPPLTGLVAEDPRFVQQLGATRRTTIQARARILGGDVAGGARMFVEEIAHLPGGWAEVPSGLQATYLQNAGTWVAECDDPTASALDLDEFKAMRRPVLLTTGSGSDPVFRAVEEKLAERLWSARGHLFPDAGPQPYRTDPVGFVEVATQFGLAAPGFE